MEGRRGNNQRNQQASASEGSEILRTKMEMLEALMEREGTGLLFPKLTAEEPQQAGAGKTKRKKVIKTRLPQHPIDYMIATPHPTVDELSEDQLAKHTKKYRESYAKAKVRSDKIRAYLQAVIDQYNAKGYAGDEEEVTDEEDEMVEN